MKKAVRIIGIRMDTIPHKQSLLIHDLSSTTLSELSLSCFA